MIIDRTESRSLSSRDRRRLGLHLELPLDSEPLELAPLSGPLVPVAWSGGVPIWAPGSGYLLAPEGGGE